MTELLHHVGSSRLHVRLLALLLLAAPGVAESQPSAAAPVDSTLERVSLAMLERSVLEHNPELRAAERAWASVRARAGQAGALDDPMVDLMLAPASLSDREVDPAWRIGVSQRIPLGTSSARRAVAQSDAGAEHGVLRATAERVLHETRLTFADYALAETTLSINRELALLVEDQRRTALARYGAGLVGQADPLQAELELSRLEREAIIQHRDRAIAQARLNVLLGRRPDELLPPPAWRDAPVRFEAALDTLAAGSGQGRGVRLQAQALLAGAEARLRLARRSRVPDLVVSIGYDRFWSESELRPTVGVSLNLPLNRGRLAAAQDEARAALESARYRQVATESEIAFEVESARLRVEEAQQEMDLLDRTMVPVSLRALGAARSGYETGRNDVATWITAAREVAMTRLAAFRARVDHLRAQSDLLRALGDAGPVDTLFSDSREIASAGSAAKWSRP